MSPQHLLRVAYTHVIPSFFFLCSEQKLCFVQDLYQILSIVLGLGQRVVRVWNLESAL